MFIRVRVKLSKEFVASSTAEEWIDRGKDLFNNKRYEQAVLCFRRASATKEENIANGYLLRELAQRTPKHDKHTYIRAFARAANAFEMCARESAGAVKRFMRIAGQCYAEAGDDVKAAKAFLNADRFNEAALHFKNAALYDDAVSVVKLHREELHPETLQSVVNVARLFYLKGSEAQIE
jgi:tetratricopeptide (TPR) repeat protein